MKSHWLWNSAYYVVDVYNVCYLHLYVFKYMRSLLLTIFSIYFPISVFEVERFFFVFFFFSIGPCPNHWLPLLFQDLHVLYLSYNTY